MTIAVYLRSSSILRIRRSAAITLSSRLVKRSSASRLETRPAVVVSATSMRLRRRSARSVYPWNSVSSLVSRLSRRSSMAPTTPLMMRSSIRASASVRSLSVMGRSLPFGVSIFCSAAPRFDVDTNNAVCAQEAV
jgi:hypothetical protein